MMAKNKINHPDWKLKAKPNNGWLIKSHSSFGGQKVWLNFNQENVKEDIFSKDYYWSTYIYSIFCRKR